MIDIGYQVQIKPGLYSVTHALPEKTVVVRITHQRDLLQWQACSPHRPLATGTSRDNIHRPRGRNCESGRSKNRSAPENDEIVPPARIQYSGSRAMP